MERCTRGLLKAHVFVVCTLSLVSEKIGSQTKPQGVYYFACYKVRTIDCASSASRYAGGVKVVARVLLAGSRSTGNEKAWVLLTGSFPPVTVSAAAAMLPRRMLDGF